jgi:hypothetical protein
VTRRDTPEQPAYRLAREEDRAELGSFECTTGLACEDKVQQFIREKALDNALNPAQQYTLLVFVSDRRLVAVAGFHPEVLLVGPPGSQDVEARAATRLSVAAINCANQGRSFGGRRLSDLVMETAIATTIGVQPSAILTGIVARANARGLILCERHGLTSQTQYDLRHVRVSGLFQRR